MIKSADTKTIDRNIWKERVGTFMIPLQNIQLGVFWTRTGDLSLIMKNAGCTAAWYVRHVSTQPGKLYRFSDSVEGRTRVSDPRETRLGNQEQESLVDVTWGAGLNAKKRYEAAGSELSPDRYHPGDERSRKCRDWANLWPKRDGDAKHRRRKGF